MSSAENPHAGQGMVVLDIGGDIGALIVSALASMQGLEIEICPSGTRHDGPDEGADWWQGQWRSHSHASEHSHTDHHEPAWPHVSVLGRPTGAGLEYSAVYPGLRQGRYDLWLRRPGEPITLTVDILGAQVTTASWPVPAR